MRKVGMPQGVVLRTSVCFKPLSMTGTVDHERRIGGEHNYKEQNEQPDNDTRSLRMSTIAAKGTIPTDFTSTRLAAFQKRLVHGFDPALGLYELYTVSQSFPALLVMLPC
jgi:hypothetical protein